LIDVFTIFGAPHILQSDNGREFTALAISELKLLWPELVIVHGKLDTPRLKVALDIHNMLTAWMHIAVFTIFFTKRHDYTFRNTNKIEINTSNHSLYIIKSTHQ
jgi:hypothetical protein